MDSRSNPLYLAVSLGRWFGVGVRFSPFFALLAIALIVRFDLWMGLLLTGVIFVSVLLHEFGHIFGARMTGGHGDEILMWPFGGLAMTRPAGTFQSQFFTAFAGPLVSLLIALSVLPYVVAYGVTVDGRTLGAAEALYPFAVPFGHVPADLAGGTAMLIVWVNWIGFWLNLLPIYPLDGGQMLRAFIARRTDAETARVVSLRIGMLCGFVLALVGLVFDEVYVVTMGFLGLIMCMQEAYAAQSPERFDDSFMGYDFSQGYTSLERSTTAERPRSPGFFTRWKQRRADLRRQREQQERLEAAARLDALLEKVHQRGMEALSASEKRFLRDASIRFRGQDKPQP